MFMSQYVQLLARIGFLPYVGLAGSLFCYGMPLAVDLEANHIRGLLSWWMMEKYLRQACLKIKTEGEHALTKCAALT